MPLGSVTSATTVPSTSGQGISRILQLGSKGADVKRVQELLIKLGYNLTADGEFGPNTEAVVTHFQANNKIQQTKQVGPTTFNRLEAMVLSLPTAKANQLSIPGMEDYVVGSMVVLNASTRKLAAGASSDKKIKDIQPSEIGCDVVVNGTFSDYYPGDPKELKDVPVGTIIRNSKLDTEGYPKARNRGAVAVLPDGSVRVLQARGSSEKEIRALFGGVMPRYFMGGGVLFINNGAAVSNDNLVKEQLFDQGNQGYKAPQMYAAQHTYVGIGAKGQTHVLFGKDKETLLDAQKRLLALGFINAVKFDGSSGSICRTNTVKAVGGYNGICCTGLGIKLRAL